MQKQRHSLPVNVVKSIYYGLLLFLWQDSCVAYGDAHTRQTRLFQFTHLVQDISMVHIVRKNAKKVSIDDNTNRLVLTQAVVDPASDRGSISPQSIVSLSDRTSDAVSIRKGIVRLVGIHPTAKVSITMTKELVYRSLEDTLADLREGAAH